MLPSAIRNVIIAATLAISTANTVKPGDPARFSQFTKSAATFTVAYGSEQQSCGH
jgi:hypothetical protein